MLSIYLRVCYYTNTHVLAFFALVGGACRSFINGILIFVCVAQSNVRL